MSAVCEPVQDSTFFGRTFVGAISIGLVFLLDGADQRQLFGNVANVLEPGGRFLFSAPREVCEWRDTLTDRTRSVRAYAVVNKAPAEHRLHYAAHPSQRRRRDC